MKILCNARIYTLDSQVPIASALCIDQGRVTALDVGQEALTSCKDSVDMHGRVILPGLTDAHLHLEHFALGLQRVDCETDTRALCLERVARHARKTPAGGWVLGHGWNHNEWPEGLGNAADLDAVVAEKPVYLTAKSLHAAWANSAALRLAGIHAGTPDPSGGQIGRSADGTPNGILYESAMEMVGRVVPEASVEEVAAAIEQAQAVLWKMGLTGIHDFDRRRCFLALQALHARERLKLRVLKSVPLEDLPHAAALGLSSGFGDDFLRIGSVKVFADGALGPQTAAMLQPYEGRPGAERGMLLMDAEELFEHGRMAIHTGLSLTVHAIGDRANHEVLNAYSQLRRYEQEQHLPALRHRIEHVQLLHPDDVGRLAGMGVVASMQPVHAVSDMLMADRYWGKRAALSYAWRSQLDCGARLAFGSDAPVESPNPFWGLHAAVTRRRADGSPGDDGWYPAQRLSIADALQAYTQGPAYAAGMENRLGRLTPGYLADLIVLNEDPFTCPPEMLRELVPCATMVAGEWVYQE